VPRDEDDADTGATVDRSRRLPFRLVSMTVRRLECGDGPRIDTGPAVRSGETNV
jgi:hypothetical protein